MGNAYMRKVKEVIVVEGRYDKNTIAQVVDSVIIETSGFNIFSDSEKLALLRKIADTRGLILFTDSDKAGFQIRGKLRGMLGGAGVKHAYIPDIPGREKRKASMSKEGKLGVEGMTREVIIEALKRAGATFEDASARLSCDFGNAITKNDLYVAGLSGGRDSANKRRGLLRRLGLPERLSANSLVEVLNVLYTRDEFMDILSRLSGQDF